LGIYPTFLGGRMYQDLRLLFPWLGFPKRTSTYGHLNDTLEQTTTMITGARRPFFLFIHIHEPHESKVMPSLSMLARKLRSQFVDKRNTELEIYKHYDSALQPEVDSYKAEYEASGAHRRRGAGRLLRFSSPATLVRRGANNYHRDHGDSFERGYLYHGEELYENSTWVSTGDSLSWQKSGARGSGLTQTIDIAPTILKTLGVTIPDWMDGRRSIVNRPRLKLPRLHSITSILTVRSTMSYLPNWQLVAPVQTDSRLQ
jgi:hypothetical protein